MPNKPGTKSVQYTEKYPKGNSHDIWLQAFRQQLKHDGVVFDLVWQEEFSEDRISFRIWTTTTHNQVYGLFNELVIIKRPIPDRDYKNKTELEIISQLFIENIEQRDLFLVRSFRNQLGTLLRCIKRKRHQRPLMYRITRLLGLIK